MSTTADHLAAYDAQLRTEAASALAVTRLGPFYLATSLGGRGRITYGALVDDEGTSDVAVGEHDFAPFAKGEESTGWGMGRSSVRRLCERDASDLRFENGEDGTVAYLPLRKGAALSPASRTPSALRAGD